MGRRKSENRGQLPPAHLLPLTTHKQPQTTSTVIQKPLNHPVEAVPPSHSLSTPPSPPSSVRPMSFSFQPCELCGTPTEQRCGKCEKSAFCSPEHQKLVRLFPLIFSSLRLFTPASRRPGRFTRSNAAPRSRLSSSHQGGNGNR